MKQLAARECPGPSYQDIIRGDSTPVAQVLAVRSNPPQSTADIPFYRYTSREFFELEMQKVWPRTWQFACRAEHLREPGDYYVYDIGRYSILIVRSEDSIKAYHNSCLHRGTKLKPSGTSGWSARISCPFHGWTWELDGSLNEVPCAWEFAHLDYEANRLPEVKAEIWNGFVFINMDESAPPLVEYLEVMPDHFARWPLDDWYTYLHVRKILSCNWKSAQEAFMEAYHTPLVHPEMTHVVGDWNMQHDIFGDHVSRDLCPMAVSSPTSTKNLSQQQLLDSMLVGDPEAQARKVQVPEGSTARIVMAQQTRARMAQDYGIDLSDRSDAEVIDSLKYNVFPNSIIYGSPTLPLIQQFRPLGMDPDKCTLDMLIFRPVKPGEEAPLPADPVTISEDDSYCDVPGMDPFLGAVLDQDTAIMRWQNEGMHASHKAAETLSSYQEARIRRLNETLDKYVNRPERTAAGGHAGAT
jgi:phenylpropionate dioxygenase-like ring-hydroxylating dioxygenase large terminal subunit